MFQVPLYSVSFSVLNGCVVKLFHKVTMKVSYDAFVLLQGSRLLALMAKNIPYQLSCTLSTDKKTYMPKEPVMLTFQITNKDKCDLYVLKWHTPLEGFRNNFLSILHGNEEIKYKGIMAKRGNPVFDSYILVPSGDSVESRVDLCRAYDIEAPGRYSVKMKGGLMDVIPKEAGVFLPNTLGSMNPVEVSCNVIEFDITS